jgi:hypothetical protein
VASYDVTIRSSSPSRTMRSRFAGHPWALMCAAAFMLAGAPVHAAPATNTAAPPQGAQSLAFGGTTYVHRWSKNGQNEFTPPDDADLARWRDMVTINVHDTVRDGDALAALANGVLGNYQKFGKVLRTDSRPRTAQRPAEHFVVAVLGDPGFLEAAFARFVLVDGGALVIVYSHRIYASKAGDAMSQWLSANGPAIEKTLMGWDKAPSIPALKTLPQSAGK